MAIGAVKDEEACGFWQRGLDCGFDEDRFHAVVLVIWLSTALAFVGKACLHTRRTDAPSGASRRCLLLAAFASVCAALDDILVLSLSKPDIYDEQDDEYYPDGPQYRYGTTTVLGSAVLVFALRCFAHLWADVAGALERLRQSQGGDHALPDSRTMWQLAVVRRSYDAIAVLHFPFALALVIAMYPSGPTYDNAMFAWIGWCFVSACCASSLLALLMWRVVATRLADEPKAKSLRRVTAVNLCEQGLYDLALLACAVLYSSTAYNEHGAVQGTVYVLTFLLLWLMHAKVLVFFIVCDPRDALYSQQEYEALMVQAEFPSRGLDPAAAADGGHAAPAGGRRALGTLLASRTPQPEKLGAATLAGKMPPCGQPNADPIGDPEAEVVI